MRQNASISGKWLINKQFHLTNKIDILSIHLLTHSHIQTYFDANAARTFGSIILKEEIVNHSFIISILVLLALYLLEILF